MLRCCKTISKCNYSKEIYRFDGRINWWKLDDSSKSLSCICLYLSILYLSLPCIHLLSSLKYFLMLRSRRGFLPCSWFYSIFLPLDSNNKGKIQKWKWRKISSRDWNPWIGKKIRKSSIFNLSAGVKWCYDNKILINCFFN